jgi:hypothetical protein
MLGDGNKRISVSLPDDVLAKIYSYQLVIRRLRTDGSMPTQAEAITEIVRSLATDGVSSTLRPVSHTGV